MSAQEGQLAKANWNFKAHHLAVSPEILAIIAHLFNAVAELQTVRVAPVRFVVGLFLMIRASKDAYGNLEGRRLEALARLFAQNVRIYVYPMTATDLGEWLKSVSITGCGWTETNGWVSASQLRCAPPLGQLFAYLLASNFLVPMRVAPGT